MFIFPLLADGIMGNYTKPTYRWAQQFVFPYFENHGPKERYTNKWSLDSRFQFRDILFHFKVFVCAEKDKAVKAT